MLCEQLSTNLGRHSQQEGIGQQPKHRKLSRLGPFFHRSDHVAYHVALDEMPWPRSVKLSLGYCRHGATDGRIANRRSFATGRVARCS